MRAAIFSLCFCHSIVGFSDCLMVFSPSRLLQRSCVYCFLPYLPWGHFAAGAEPGRTGVSRQAPRLAGEPIEESSPTLGHPPPPLIFGHHWKVGVGYSERHLPAGHI